MNQQLPPRHRRRKRNWISASEKVSSPLLPGRIQDSAVIASSAMPPSAGPAVAIAASAGGVRPAAPPARLRRAWRARSGARIR